MSAAPTLTSCSGCQAQIAPGLLACPGCQRLVHRDRLALLAAEAQAAEARGDYAAALGTWRDALPLLPPGAGQRATIDLRMRTLSAGIDGRAAPEGAPALPPRAPVGRLAGAGAVGLLIWKLKAVVLLLLGNAKLLLVGLTKLPTLLSLLLYAQWSSGRGAGIALGVVGCIYVHEIGHVAALRRYGVEATAPMFVPGLGAFVRLKQYPTDAHEEARVGLAGPLWGLVASLGAAGIGYIWASPLALAVASLSATLNLFNLIPVWQLDGARGLHALSQRERWVVAGTALAAALLLHQGMPLAIAALTSVRALDKGAPAAGDRAMLALFVALVGGLSLIARLLPDAAHFS